MITLHPTSPTQAPLLADLHAASFEKEAWTLEQIQGSLALDTTQGWIALENGKPLGFILCQTTPEQTEILTFAVHPQAQRRGIGKQLLQQIITTDTGKIFLEVAADNHAAKALYEKLGFHTPGIRRDYYRREGTSVDAILYERSFPNNGFTKLPEQGMMN